VPDRLFVVAGSWAEFTAWCHERRISPRDRSVAYVRDWTSLMGQPRGLRYVVVGTGRERRDFQEISHALHWRDAIEGEAPAGERGGDR
jgi:hypothetical protein